METTNDVLKDVIGRMKTAGLKEHSKHMLKTPTNLAECDDTECDACSRYLGYGARICDFRKEFWKIAHQKTEVKSMLTNEQINKLTHHIITNYDATHPLTAGNIHPGKLQDAVIKALKEAEM